MCPPRAALEVVPAVFSVRPRLGSTKRLVPGDMANWVPADNGDDVIAVAGERNDQYERGRE